VLFFSITAFQIYNKNDRLEEKMKMFGRGSPKVWKVGKVRKTNRDFKFVMAGCQLIV
jgi:hypothetical protein